MNIGRVRRGVDVRLFFISHNVREFSCQYCIQFCKSRWFSIVDGYVSSKSIEPEFESESESSYSSVPIISVKAEIQGTPLEAGIDSGATINLISEEIDMPSEPASPINLHQAMAPDAVLLDRKVTSDVHLPSESWHSTH